VCFEVLKLVIKHLLFPTQSNNSLFAIVDSDALYRVFLHLVLMDSPSSDVSVSLERPIVEEESRTATQKNRRATVGRHANSSNNITPLQSLDDEFETVLSFKTNPWQTWIPSGFWAGACIAAAGIVLSVSPIERSWYVAATLLIFSIAFALRARSEVYTFDPNTHFFTLQKRALWGSSVMTVSFNEIKEVKLEESTDTQGIF